MTTSEKIRNIKQELIRKYLQEYDSWLLTALKENFPDESLSVLVREVKVEKWPNHTVLTRHGVSFAVWKEPTFKWEVLCQ